MATPKGVRGQIVNKAQLAKLVGRPVKTIDDWARRGMPVLEKGSLRNQWQIDTAAVIAWLIEERTSGTDEESGEKLDLSQEKARESKERADKLSLENRLMRKELIRVEDVVALWAKMIGAAKRQLRGVPISIKNSGVIPDLTPQQAAGILDLIDEGLAELSGVGVPELDGEPMEDVGEGVGTAA